MPRENRLLQQFYIGWIIPKSSREHLAHTRHFTGVHFVFILISSFPYSTPAITPQGTHDAINTAQCKPGSNGTERDLQQKKHQQEHSRSKQSDGCIIIQLALD